MNFFNQLRNRFIPINRSLFVLLLFAILILPLSGCFMLPEEEETIAPPVVLKEPVVKKIVTEKVRKGNIENRIKFWGYFMPSEMSDLFFTDMGRLESVNVVYGDRVKAGDLLAKLESDDLDLQLSQMQISLEKAELRYKNLQEKSELNGGGFTYELEDAKLTIDSIELSIANITEKLSKVSITSPTSGIVAYINPVKLGNYVPIRTTFITVCDPTTMVLVVKESQAPYGLQVGQELTVLYNGTSYTGVVQKTPDDNTNEKNANLKGAYTLIVEGLDVNQVNLNDMASVEQVIAKADDVLIIDKSNIRSVDGKNYVNVYKDGVIEEREVEIGVESDNGIDVEIKKGLTETDEILVP